jgi:hypothetical protein
MLENLFKKKINVRKWSFKPTGEITKVIATRIFIWYTTEENIPSIELSFKNGISNSTSCTPSNEHGSLSRT